MRRFGLGLGLLARRKRGAAAAHTYGAEWSPDVGFDVPATWNLNGAGGSVSGSVLTLPISLGRRALATMSGTPPPGDYLIAFDCTVVPDSGTLNVVLGSSGGNIPVTSTGPGTALLTGLAPASTSLTYIATTTGVGGSFNSISVKQQLT